MLRSVLFQMLRPQSLQRLLFGLFAVFLAMGATTAQAQSEQDARQRFLQGAQLFQQERYAEALSAFEESYQIRPVPVVLFNIGQTLWSLHRGGEAAAAFEQYLAQAEEIPPRQRRAIEETLAQLRQELGLVRVFVNVEGAQVRANGRDLGSSPFDMVHYVDPGPVLFRGEAPGHEAAEERVSVAAGAMHEVHLELPRSDSEALLVVDATAPGVLLVDGQSQGELPLELRLEPGDHTLRIEADDHEPWEQTISLGTGEERRFRAELEEEGSVLSRPWFWGVAGGVVAVGIIAAIVAASIPGESEPLHGTLPTIGALGANR